MSIEFEYWWLLALPLFFTLGWIAARVDIKQLTEDPSGATASVTSEDKAAKPKAKPAKTKAEAPSAEDNAAAAGTTNLGALLKAKMDSKK